MNTRSTLVTAALLAAAAMPSWGQTAGPAAVPANGGVQGVSIPDFSGMWARVSFPGFGRPLAGAGPVINKNRCPNGAPCFAGARPLINKNRSPNGVPSPDYA